MQQTEETVLNEIGQFVKKSNYGEAITICRNFLQSDNENIKILLKLGDLYVRIANYRLATVQYLKAADLLTRDGFYARAISIHDTILHYDPENLKVLQKMLELYQKLGYKDEIIACKEKIGDIQIIKENDTRTKSEKRLIQSAKEFEKKGEWSNAIFEYQKYLKKNPADIEIYLKIAQLHAEQLYNIDTAINYYLQAAELSYEKGLFIKAKHIYETALKLDENNLTVLNKVLTFYKGAGYSEEVNRLQAQINKAKVFKSKTRTNSLNKKLRLSREVDKLIKRAQKGDKRALNQLYRLNRKISSFLENQEPKKKKVPAKKKKQ